VVQVGEEERDVLARRNEGGGWHGDSITTDLN
jgi:hypothetical protein